MTAAASAVSSALSLFAAARRPHKGNIWDPLNSLKWRHRRYSWTRPWPTWRRSRRRWSPSWRRREPSCTTSSVSAENGEASLGGKQARRDGRESSCKSTDYWLSIGGHRDSLSSVNHHIRPNYYKITGTFYICGGFHHLYSNSMLKVFMYDILVDIK